MFRGMKMGEKGDLKKVMVIGEGGDIAFLIELVFYFHLCDFLFVHL